jgi:hypothetical protein
MLELMLQQVEERSKQRPVLRDEFRLGPSRQTSNFTEIILNLISVKLRSRNVIQRFQSSLDEALEAFIMPPFL